MMALSNSANSGQPLLEHISPADQWLEEINAPTDLSTATWAGRVADIIALMIDNSGMSQVYIIEFKRNVNEEAIELLQTWIEQYGSDRDPDLDEQMKELNANRLAFRP